MDSISVSGLGQELMQYTAKQQKLINDLSCVVSKIGIKIIVNPRYCLSGQLKTTVSLDIEHDEQGNMVGIGLYDGYKSFYLTKLFPDDYYMLQAYQFICHNGISDIECLRMWGINVRDEQLIWDTMLIQHILDSSQKDYSLKGMSKRELGIIYPSYDDIVGKRGLKAERVTLDKQPLELVSMYNALDTYCTWKLYENQKRQIG